MTWAILFLSLQFEAACFRSTVVDLCCQSACAIKSRRNVWQADESLKACAESLGCKPWSWSVGMTCECK